MRARHAILPALAVVFAAGLARAQTTPAQAQALESQITAFLAGVGGVPPPSGGRPVQMTAEGDHYLVRVPLGSLGLTGLTPADAAITAKATPLGGTRWSLEDQRFPAEVSFSATQPVPDPASPDPNAPPRTHDELVAYHVTLGQQDSAATIDTAWATPMLSRSALATLDWTRTSSAGATATHFDRLTSQSTTRPIDPAHADLAMDATGEHYFTKFETPSGQGSSLSADHVHTTASVSTLAHDKLLPLLAGAMQLARETRDTAHPDPAMLRALLQTAMNLLTGGRVEQSMEGVKFDSYGVTGGLRKLEVSFGGDAPGSSLATELGFSLAGLTVDSLPPAFASYVPTLVALHATVSNVNAAALTRMGLDATNGVNANSAPMFANGGIAMAFDRLAIDIAGAELRGTGHFTATGPRIVTGQADITARGLDDLLAKAQNDPTLKAGVPFVIFLKGIAKTDGDRSLWQLTLANGKTLVNGVDLSSLMGK